MILSTKSIKGSYYYCSERITEDGYDYGIWIPFIINEDDIDMIKSIISEDDVEDTLAIIYEKYNPMNIPLSISVLLSIIAAIRMIDAYNESEEDEGSEKNNLFTCIEYVIHDGRYRFFCNEDKYCYGVGFFVVYTRDIDKIFREMKNAPDIIDSLDFIMPSSEKFDPWILLRSAIYDSTGLFVYAMDFLKDMVLEISENSDNKMPDDIYDSMYRFRGVDNIYELRGILKGYKRTKGNNIVFRKKMFNHTKYFLDSISGSTFEEIFKDYSDMSILIDFNNYLHEAKRKSTINEYNLSIAEKIMLDVITEKEKEYENSFLGL